MADNQGLRVETSNGESQALPALAAAFCVVFDVRKGYTLVWSKAAGDVELEGVVEFKSLPSGLHNVEEDLIYFVHKQYAGISAFLNRKGSESERNARMLAVGVLIPLRNGRMGQSWRHAESLKNLAKKQVDNLENFDALEEYWTKHQISNDNQNQGAIVESPSDSFINVARKQQLDGYQKTRAMNDVAPVATKTSTLSKHHPATCLPFVFKLFGPLVFPLYRAALLRKRILLVGEAPVEINCNYVYALSVLSSIQRTLLPLLPEDDVPDMRLRPLFNVGVQDIPLLSKSKESAEFSSELHHGWIACTTDDVLGTKPELFDILVILPPPHSKDASTKIYPKIVQSSPALSRTAPISNIRSTQRDARRYINLRSNLQQLSHSFEQQVSDTAVGDSDAQSEASVASSTLSRASIVEPQSWPLIAYTSLIWWASAGEKRSGPSEDEAEEAEQDAQLLGNDYESDGSMSTELAIVAYFHRLTNTVFATLSDAISRADGDEYSKGLVDDTAVEDGDPMPAAGIPDSRTNGDHSEDDALLSNEVVEITQDDLTRMGLDVWSASDRKFVADLLHLWWGREAVVKGGRIECCGVQIL